MATVHLEAISKHFGPTTAVEDVSLDIADGEFLTLLGPSGCGKTTTLRMVAGLVEPSAGRILFDDEDVTYLAPRVRNIGFVFQTPALFPHLSVADNIGFGLSVKHAKKDAIRARVEGDAALVGLAGYGARLPSQLSGGQQQRSRSPRSSRPIRESALRRPLSALDKNLRDQLKYGILDLQRRTRKTAIYVTHDQSEAFAISDRIVVMNAGRVEQIGTQTEIYLHPATPFVAEFIGATNGFSGTVTGYDGDGAAARVVVSSDGVTLRSRHESPLEVGTPVIAYIRPEDVEVLPADGSADGFDNVLEGSIDRVIFEGPTAQVRVDIGGREFRADVGGGQRLALGETKGRIRLGFDDVTLVPVSGPRPAAVDGLDAGEGPASLSSTLPDPGDRTRRGSTHDRHVRPRWRPHRLEPSIPLPEAVRRRGRDGAVPGRGHDAGMERGAGRRPAVVRGGRGAHGEVPRPPRPHRCVPRALAGDARRGDPRHRRRSSTSSALVTSGLYALSNWSAETFPVALERYPFLGWFDGIVISGEVGAAKPDVRIFQALIDRHEIEPAETVFVDDNEPNVTAAAAMGFIALRFHDAERFARISRGSGSWRADHGLDRHQRPASQQHAGVHGRPAVPHRARPDDRRRRCLQPEHDATRGP
jgi:putative spermidine/putrescine transport system ATP-binding protein